MVLDDPEHNFLAGNIVPLVNSQKKSDRLKEVLDAVSAKLTTAAWPSSTPRCQATPASTPTRQLGNGCGTTISTIRSGVDGGNEGKHGHSLISFNNVSKVYADGTVAVDELNAGSTREAR